VESLLCPVYFPASPDIDVCKAPLYIKGWIRCSRIRQTVGLISAAVRVPESTCVLSGLEPRRFDWSVAFSNPLRQLRGVVAQKYFLAESTGAMCLK